MSDADVQGKNLDHDRFDSDGDETFGLVDSSNCVEETDEKEDSRSGTLSDVESDIQGLSHWVSKIYSRKSSGADFDHHRLRPYTTA